MPKRVVITGIGVISPNGIGKNAYWKALADGESGIKEITLFDSKNYSTRLAGEAVAFDPKQSFTKRELILFDRATLLLLASAKEAVEDSGVVIQGDSKELGVAVGTTFGSLKSLSDFDKESFVKGPQLVNPSLFPNTVANLPASQISIFFKIRGFNATVSTGMCAGVDAIDYGVRSINNFGKKIVLTGALEEFCEQSFLGFYHLQMLAGTGKRPHFDMSPFGRNRGGVILGEGATTLILEELESAQKREGKIYAEVMSTASVFDPYRLNRHNPKATGMIRAMRIALERANLFPEDIDFICANANSTQDADLCEAKAIQEVFGKEGGVCTTSIKSMVGETYSAAGGLAAVAALGAINQGFIPPIINFRQQDPSIEINLVKNTSRKKVIKTCMVNAFDRSGACSVLIIRKYEK